MASSSLTFADWRQQTNEGLMATAEKLLEQLEDVSDLLTEIDEKYILVSHHLLLLPPQSCRYVTSCLDLWLLPLC